MTPFSFGAAGQALFGVYHAPNPTAARNSAVLLCAPIGLEYMRTHYSMRLLANHLANAGLHVLRFDYRGTGDSSGSIGSEQMDCWIEDINLAAREICDIAATQDLAVCGLRAGALLAALAISRGATHPRRLVLWDPIVRGGSYLEDLCCMHECKIGGRRDDSDELLGMRYPADLRGALTALDLATLIGHVRTDEFALVTSAEREDYTALALAARARWPQARARFVADPVDWRSIRGIDDARMTGPIIRAVAEELEAAS